MTCVVESHVDLQDINEWLHSDVGYGRIRDLLIQRGHDPVPSSTLGRHREKCLGLEPKKMVRSDVAPKQLPVPPPTLPLPSEQELVDEAKRVLFWRLKTKPQDVPSNVLGTILTASMREKKPDRQSAFEEILEQLGKDETPETAESLATPDDGSETDSDP